MVGVEPGKLVLPSGETVMVRELNGMDMAMIGKRQSVTADDDESVAGIATQIGFAVLGKTRVRDAEAAGTAWLRNHSGRDFAAVMERIQAVSGFGQGAAKSDVPGAGDGS